MTINILMKIMLNVLTYNWNINKNILNVYEHKHFCNWFKAVEVVAILLHPIIQFSFMFIVY